MCALPDLLEKSASLHSHLCPRQVLGVRMGMFAGALLHLDLPQTDKRFFVFVETDGCFAGGISVTTGCWLGHRTLRFLDYGKVAATFVDSETGEAIRIWPHPDSREQALHYAPAAKNPWYTQLEAYQTMPSEKLMCWRPVALTMSLHTIISWPGVRVCCSVCGEEILNEREIMRDGLPVCQSCAHGGYYLFNTAAESTIPYSGPYCLADQV